MRAKIQQFATRRRLEKSLVFAVVFALLWIYFPDLLILALRGVHNACGRLGVQPGEIVHELSMTLVPVVFILLIGILYGAVSIVVWLIGRIVDARQRRRIRSAIGALSS